jgi:hypothetical protein
MSKRLSDIQPKLKALSIYQIIGGVIGIVATIHLIVTITQVNGLLLLIFLFAIGLFSYSIFCGVTLLKAPVKGLRLSKVNQLLQAAHFNLFGYAFQYVSGIHFSPGLDLTDSFNFKLNLSLSTWQISLNTREADVIISLNLVALFLIVFIDKAIQQFKIAEQDEKIMQLGVHEEQQQLTQHW